MNNYIIICNPEQVKDGSLLSWSTITLPFASSVIMIFTHPRWSLCALILTGKCLKQNNKEWVFFCSDQPIFHYQHPMDCVFFVSQMIENDFYTMGWNCQLIKYIYQKVLKERCIWVQPQTALSKAGAVGLFLQTFLMASPGFSVFKRVSCLPYSIHLHSNTQECRKQGKKIIRRRQSCAGSPDRSKTYCTLEEDHVDWHAGTTFIHQATLSHTARSDFKPSHPPTSSPKPPPSSAINHHLATGQWARWHSTLLHQHQVGNRKRDRERERKEGRRRKGQ